MIAITGASGNLGRSTTEFLLKKIEPSQIIAIVRDPKKLNDLKDTGIEIRNAHYDDFESFKTALQGVEKLLQISTTSIGKEGIRQEGNVVHAAIENKIDHIIYTSSLNPKSDAHFLATLQSLETEKAIKKSGLNYTFFRNSLYMEAIPQLIGNALTDSMIYYPGGTGEISFVSRIDIAEALSIVLTEEGHADQVYDITGQKNYTFQDLADILGETKGRSFEYEPISIDAYGAELTKYHLPGPVIDLLVSMARGIRENEFAYLDDTLQKILGRKPLPLKRYLESE
ncbi:MAG: SDR family oxidoreductase [Cytophagales bacterium]|nr:SDR family oxidoreductase [Cytophagales bacterium]